MTKVKISWVIIDDIVTELKSLSLDGCVSSGNMVVSRTFLYCIVHIYPPFTRKRIVSLHFGRDVCTRLGVAISEMFGVCHLSST